MHEPDEATSNFWLNAFLARDRRERDLVLEYTNARGVMTRPLWNPMHTLAPFRDCPRAELPNSEWIEARLVKLPSSVPPDGLGPVSGR
jgi:dTDP-4-amino-4,6-dideoxygalactose transaminase